MKEYKMEIRYADKYEGKWVTARTPFGAFMGHTFSDLEKAKAALGRLEIQWEKENTFGHEPPAEYRIVGREVGRWHLV